MGLFGSLFNAAAGAMANAVQERKEMASKLYELLDSGAYGDTYELRRIVDDWENQTVNYNLKNINRTMVRKYSCNYGYEWIVGRIKSYLGIDD